MLLQHATDILADILRKEKMKKQQSIQSVSCGTNNTTQENAFEKRTLRSKLEDEENRDSESI